jgi:AraC-like DNA-binding protein
VDSATLAELDILLHAMAMESRQRSVGAELLLISHLLNLLVLVLRKSCSYVERERFNSDIGIAVAFMRRNYQEEISLPRLARLANLSESSFFRKFREEMKTSPMQWLLNLRIRKAMEFLIRSDMNIGEIAAATGFSDSLYFSRQFRRQVGVSPKNYRAQAHGPRQVIHGMQTLEEIGDI